MSLLNRLGLKEERRVIYYLYFVGFMDLFAVSLVLPLMARRGRELGGSPAAIGALGSLYGALQLFSSPVMGRISDIIGRRKVLLMSFLGVCVSFVFYGQAASFAVMLLCRIPTGIFKHSQTMAKTLLADRTPRLEHPNVLGTFNAISSMGFIVGPLIGGHVAMLENGFSKCTSIAAVIFFTCFVFVWIFVEEAPVRGGEDSAGKDTEQRESDTVARQRTPIKSENGSSPSPADGSTANERGDQSSSSPSFFDFLKLASASSIFDLLVIRFVMSFAMLIFRSNFGTMLEFRYGTTPKTNGYITSYNGILSACSGFLVGPLMSKVYNNNDTKMLLHSAVLLTLAILGITLSPSVFTLVLFIAPLSLGSAVSRVCVTNLTYNRGNKEERGMLQGIGNSLTSMSRMLAPLLGGFAQEVSIYGPGLLGVGCASIAVVAIHLSGRERETVAARKKAD